jgi:uncharacterized cupredoxin-like copper-binding protein
VQSTRTRTSVVIAAAVLIAVVAIGLVSLAGSLGGDDSPSSPSNKAAAPAATGPATVDVQLSDFKIRPSQATVPAGKVTFAAKNAGDEEHEMVVVRTDKAAGSLAGGKDEASEAGAVGEIPEFDAGRTERKAFNLKPGRYVLLCNVPGHYKAGMYTTFTVR